MPYTLRRSTRARRTRVTVHPDGSVVVTAPVGEREEVIRRFVQRHEAWIAAARSRAAKRTPLYIRRSDIPRLKRTAKEFAERAAARFAAFYGVRVGTITIRAQRTRWGSCSHRGDLSINYRIAALPLPLAEYVIAHEVCHILELNHSPRFWAHLARSIPDHAERRRALRAIATMYI